MEFLIHATTLINSGNGDCVDMLTEDGLIDLLAHECQDRLQISATRPGVFQVHLPFFHEDGDPVEVFVKLLNDGTLQVTDYGFTVMRLSYTYDLDTDNKTKVFKRILSENQLKEKDGEIFLKVQDGDLYPTLMALISGIMKVGSMKYFKKEVIQSLFYESVENFVLNRLSSFKPMKNFYPIQKNQVIDVDYVIESSDIPFYIFAVRGTAQAKTTTIKCLMLEREKIPFNSIVIHENMDSLTNKDRSYLTDVVDKQFSSFQSFEQNSIDYFNRKISTPLQQPTPT